MPHYTIDSELVAEAAEEVGQELTGDESTAYYETAETTVDFAKADEWARKVRDVLIGHGYTVVYVTYDGGYDEGFANLEAAGDGASLPRAEQLADELAEAIADEVGLIHAPPGLPQAIRQEMERRQRDEPPADRVRQLLDDLADFLATQLLGESFGVGEVTMRGRLRCDLTTGHAEDVEENPPPLPDRYA